MQLTRFEVIAGKIGNFQTPKHVENEKTDRSGEINPKAEGWKKTLILKIKCKILMENTITREPTYLGL